MLAGEVDGEAVITKRSRTASPVWAWYAQHEVAVYRAFAEHPPPFRTPRLIAALDSAVVLERIAGEPLAIRRRPHLELAPPILASLLETLVAIERAHVAVQTTPPPPNVRTQMRARLLEDPTSNGAWIVEGLERCARTKLLDEATGRRAIAALDGAPRVFAHGDLLLRNVIGAADHRVVLIDWECAGIHVRDWDRALLWTQLGPASRARVESTAENRDAFRALVVFALARELRFVRAFGGDDRAIRAELEAITR